MCGRRACAVYVKRLISVAIRCGVRRPVDRMFALLDKKRPLPCLLLPVARAAAGVTDTAADLTGVGFPITSARIERFYTDTELFLIENGRVRI